MSPLQNLHPIAVLERFGCRQKVPPPHPELGIRLTLPNSAMCLTWLVAREIGPKLLQLARRHDDQVQNTHQ